jgi:phytoene synthase
MTGDPRGAEWRFPNPATPAGSSAYYSIRFAPAPLRDTLAALFGWRQQVRLILDEVSDPGVARLKLDWWRDELGRCAAGAPRHPLSLILSPAMAVHALPAAPFLAVADRVETELRGRRAAGDDAARTAAEQDLGSLFELAARCHGLTGAGELARARRLGGWCGQVRRIRDGGLLLRRGRDAVPESRLAAAGLTPEALASAEHRHRLPGLVEPLARALEDQRPTPAETASMPAALRIQARIHAVLLAELARSGYAVTDQRIGLTPLRKLWIAWRAR